MRPRQHPGQFALYLELPRGDRRVTALSGTAVAVATNIHRSRLLLQDQLRARPLAHVQEPPGELTLAGKDRLPLWG